MVADHATRMRRLRAHLAVTADILRSRRDADLAEQLSGELAFLTKLATREQLVELCRDLRARALALAADLPADDASIALLEGRAALDEAALGQTLG